MPPKPWEWYSHYSPPVLDVSDLSLEGAGYALLVSITIFLSSYLVSVMWGLCWTVWRERRH